MTVTLPQSMDKIFRMSMNIHVKGIHNANKYYESSFCCCLQTTTKCVFTYLNGNDATRSKQIVINVALGLILGEYYKDVVQFQEILQEALNYCPARSYGTKKSVASP